MSFGRSIVCCYGYLTTVEEVTAAGMTGGLVGMSMLVAAWAGIWALATRISRGRGHFLQHAAISCWIMAVLFPTIALLGVVVFLWPGALTDTLRTGVGALFFALLLHAQLEVSSRLSTWVRALTGVGIVAGLMGLGMLFETVDPDPTLNVQDELGALLPVPAGMVPASSVSDFLDRAEALTEELEEMRDEG